MRFPIETAPPPEKPHDPSSSSPPWAKGTATLATVALVSSAVWMNRSFLIPIAMGGVFALCLAPVEQRLSQHLKSKLARSAVIVGLFAALFIVPVGILSFSVSDGILRAIQGFQNPPLSENLLARLGLREYLSTLISQLSLPEEQVLRALQEGGTAALTVGFKFLRGLVSDLPGLALSNLIVIGSLFVFLSERDRFSKALYQLSPWSALNTRRLANDAEQLARGVVLAALICGVSQASVLATASVFLGGLPPLTVLGVGFVSSFLPVVGTLPLTLVLVGRAAFEQNWFAFAGYLLAAIVAGSIDNFIRPMVLNGRAQLHPLVGFISVFGGLETMGFYGVFLGPILAGLALSLIRIHNEPAGANDVDIAL